MADKAKARNCCLQFWRYTFIVLNSLFFVLGLGLIGLSIYLLASQNDLNFLTGSNIASGSVLILISGFITSVVSLVGIIGAIGMWPILLIVYLVLLLLIVVMEVVAGILGLVYRKDLGNTVEERALDAISRYREDGDPERESDVNAIIDFIQDEFSCCGYTSSDNWLNSTYFNQTQMYPESCNCTSLSFTALNEECTMSMTAQFIFKKACNDSVTDYIERNLIILGTVGLVIGIFELSGVIIAIILTCCFCLTKKDSDSYDFDKAL